MARVTVEDCLEVIDNQYDLVILAKERTLQIGAGLKPMVPENNDKKTVLSLRELGNKLLDQKSLEIQTIDRAREHPEDTQEQEEYDTSDGDAFEEIYKGEVSKSGQAILPSKRSRKVPVANIKVDDKDESDDDEFVEDSLQETELDKSLEKTSEDQIS
ncbi:MAG: DNA-directed RNA polymerase subunit omega [Candidatus Pelagibacter sp.]|nr:DNA-directed RNA polymerase subunit omega [Candidatus Pelagibacter sp.]|tara:strand:+ start:12301 stop:12774 length:474 start_codon:yes stop_codon:yes gene_type:complete